MIAPCSESQDGAWQQRSEYKAMAANLLNGLGREFFALTRWREHVLFVGVTTLLGAQFADGTFGAPLLTVFFSNELAVAAAFMFNDIEDSSDDARDPEKRGRNPVSAGRLSRNLGYLFTGAVAAVAAAMFAWLGGAAFRLGLVTLALGFVYSWRPTRFKGIPGVDVLSHCLMLAGLQFLAAYAVFAPLRDGQRWLAPFIFVCSVSAYGQLYNQVRDLDSDREARLRHSAAILGPRRAQALMAGCLLVAGASAVYGFAVGMIPWWAGALTVVLGAGVLGLLLFGMRRGVVRSPETLHNPVLAAGLLALAAWMMVE